MKMKLDRWIALVALSGLIAACNGGGEVPAAEEEPVGEAQSALTCQDFCSNYLQQCTFSCPPDDPWLSSNPCVDQCYEYYRYCIAGC